MIAIGMILICAIIAVCFCLVGIGMSLDSIRAELSYIASKIKKGGE